MSNHFIKDYLEFHNKFGFSCPKKFKIPDNETVKVRLNFLLEELMETAIAFGYTLYNLPGESKFLKDEALPVQPLQIVDGLIDLEYVVLGTAAFCGLLSEMTGKDVSYWEYGWAIVHEANMKKIKPETIEQSTRNTLCDCIKPDDWVAPNLTAILE